MRKLILIPVLLAVVAFAGCSKKHNDLMITFPEIPVVTTANMNQSHDHVTLNWTFSDHSNVTEYRVYVGLYLEGFFGVYDETTLAHTTNAQETADQQYIYADPGLLIINEELCNQIGMCGEAWTYTQFRVTAIVNGVETIASERVFPTE